MKNVALYFGSFNPIHLGHQKLAEYLTDNDLVDEVWFVISPCNPLKKKSDLLDENLRLKMVEMSIKDKPRLKVCTIEFDMPIPSYTIDTLTVLSDRYPDHNFSLMIGSDNVFVFDKWKGFKDILSKYDVYVYPRLGYDFNDVNYLYPSMVLVDTPYYEISSTDIRTNKVDNKFWLNPDVFDFINKNKIYG